MKTLISETRPIGFLDVGSDGWVYADQLDRPSHVVRVSPSGGTVEQVAESPDETGQAIALQDGRIAFTERVAGRLRLLIAGPGKDPAPLVETDEETSTPAAPIGTGQVAFVIGSSSSQAIGLASTASGRMIRRLEGVASSPISAIAAFPDGQILYYTAAGSVWSIPAAGGQPKRLGAGDSVTVDALHNELLVRLDESSGVSLVRMALSGAPVRPIQVVGDVHLAAGSGQLSPTAVARDGRILVTAVSGSLWTWPAGILNPDTGAIQILKLGYPADVFSPGWGPDGKVVMMANPIRSSLWRFRRVN